jgi:hypothetical protein
MFYPLPQPSWERGGPSPTSIPPPLLTFTLFALSTFCRHLSTPTLSITRQRRCVCRGGGDDLPTLDPRVPTPIHPHHVCCFWGQPGLLLRLETIQGILSPASPRWCYGLSTTCYPLSCLRWGGGSLGVYSVGSTVVFCVSDKVDWFATRVNH